MQNFFPTPIYSSGLFCFLPSCQDFSQTRRAQLALRIRQGSGLQSVVLTIKVDEPADRLAVVQFYVLHLAKENAVRALAYRFNDLAIERH